MPFAERSASLNLFLSRRGPSRVATKYRGHDPTGKWTMFSPKCTERLILWGILAFHGSDAFRGTDFAKGEITMMTTAELTADSERNPALSCDWVETHADYLFNFAIGQVRDPSVAEDIVQETFLAAVKAHDTFSGQSSQRTWLTGILRHKIYDYLRKSCRERAVRHDSEA